MHDFKTHCWQDFLAYCSRPVSVHLAMVCIGRSFNSFSVFLFSLKQQQNLMKIVFSCTHFPILPYPPKIMKKNVFYTGKLYGLTGMYIFEVNHVIKTKTKLYTIVTVQHCGWWTFRAVKIQLCWQCNWKTWKQWKISVVLIMAAI